MHNLKYTPLCSLDDYMLFLSKGLHADNRTFVDTHDAEYRTAYSAYLSNINPCNLENVSPLWAESATDSQKVKSEKRSVRDQSSTLYESKSAFKEPYWKELKKLNGGKELICPLCGLDACEHLDHYIPREIMPEFSVFKPNLIPLCHDCNEDKRALWLNAHGERLFFNAFFDKLKDMPICVCNISIRGGIPYAEITANPNLNTTDTEDKLVLNTIEKLKLIKKWQHHCNQIMNKEVVRLQQDCKTTKSVDGLSYWNEKCANYSAYIANSNQWDFVEGALFRSIIASIELRDWCIQQYDEIKQREDHTNT